MSTKILSDSPIYAAAQAAISLTITNLQRLSTNLDHNFLTACQLCWDCRGHIIVMGIGKSGHIARKIAATLASTGTPAFFVHPTEAQHGDLGMLSRDDVVLMLSKSGETPELLALLPSFARLNLPLIAIVGNTHSSLAQAASITLDASITEEACHLGLAPTTSTTSALVLGDLLAICTSQQRGFTAIDFAHSHPGGQLGQRLLVRVQDVMHPAATMPVVSSTTMLQEALLVISSKNLGMTVVVDEQGRLAGVFTDGDLRRASDHEPINLHTTAIARVMTGNPKVIAPQVPALTALQLMETYKISALIVTDDSNTPLGVVRLADILSAGIV